VGFSLCSVGLRAFGSAGPEFLISPFQVRPGPRPGAVAMRSRGVAWLGWRFQVVFQVFGVFLVAWRALRGGRDPFTTAIS
jgi:hypothetical protein